MGIPDSSLLDLIEKVKSWISWGGSDLLCGEFDMQDNSCIMCCECNKNLGEISHKYHCKSCGRWLCGKCIRDCDLSVTVKPEDVKKNTAVGKTTKSCKFCFDVSMKCEDGKDYNNEVHPSASPEESPRESPEPPSPCFSVESKISSSLNGGELIKSSHLEHYLPSWDYGYSSNAMIDRSMTSFSSYPSKVSVSHSLSRSDEDEAEDSGKHLFILSSEYFHNDSDVDSSSVSARHELCYSPYESPSRINFTSSKAGMYVHQGQGGSPISQDDSLFGQEIMAVSRRTELNTEDSDHIDDCSDDLSIVRNQDEKLQRPLDFVNNVRIWYPPPPEDENGDAESNFFSYDDEDDDIGDSGALFSSSSSLSNWFPIKKKHNEGNIEPLQSVVQGHFRALVSQLLLGEDIKMGKENGLEDWLDVVATIAWQAANFVKPDTSRGGSMDPGDYVKVKCIASGSPSESTLIKGVVCTKNIKHKRMTSQYKNPKLLIIGGALEYQKVPNQLASFDTLLQQENDHLKMIISKIEALRPNVLLVEKSVSSYAQEYLLAKEISLVLNVKRPLLECISRCTGAIITPSIDNISTARLGHCELFRLERMVEEHETAIQFNKKPSKTLMFFEGCPRRLGCTVLLKGTCLEELKKVKHVVQYAVFAAYHLSLETSFLADEGATLPKMSLKHSIAMPERATTDIGISLISNSHAPMKCQSEADATDREQEIGGLCTDLKGSEPVSENLDPGQNFLPHTGSMNFTFEDALSDTWNILALNLVAESGYPDQCDGLEGNKVFPSDMGNHSQQDMQETFVQEERQYRGIHELEKSEGVDDNEVSSKYFSTTDSHQSILVYFSSYCVSKGTLCERSRLLRIKFYGCFDKPLGRYLRDDLFDQTSCCQSCKEPADAHVLCYTHQQGNLTINVRHLPSLKLPGERDGKIWMWHRCLRCARVDGVPPATRRVVMSDAAWGLSFGKFLELSFSNHATANRVATCGHSLQRDCLRYYGYGSMVAFFRYSPIDILSVCLPPSVLEFNGQIQPDWTRKEAAELLGKMETVYKQISDVLECFEQKIISPDSRPEQSDRCDLQNHVMELKALLRKEKSDYNSLLLSATLENPEPGQMTVDILELNRLRRSLLIGSHVWDHRLYSLDFLLKKTSKSKSRQGDESDSGMKELRFDSYAKDCNFDSRHEQNNSQPSKLHESPRNDMQGAMEEPKLSLFKPCAPEDLISTSYHLDREKAVHSDGEVDVSKTLSGCLPSQDSNLSERIDSAWTGTDQLPSNVQPVHTYQMDGSQAEFVVDHNDNSPFRRLISPARVYSFDSALRVRDRIRKGLTPSSLHLSTLRSFHASGDYRNMVRDPVSNVTRTHSQMLPCEAQKLNLILNSTPSFISTALVMAEGVRLLLPQTGQREKVVAVYDNEPTSIICYALCSKEYEDWVADRLNVHDGRWISHERNKEDSAASTFSAWQSFGSLDLDYIHYGRYGSEDASPSIGALHTDSKRSPHLRISFGDESSNAGGKVKFSVTCYYGKQFDSLRKKCCPSEVDFIRSLSRCRRWSAQGGKSNVYFAKSLDERFIIKQVPKTELDSFEEFAPQYFKYLTDSISSGSPTCLAKVLGIYQVTVKNLKGGKETKMDLMVMENLFFKRSISRVYDLKGSARSRYNPDTAGTNKVLLDMNLLESLRTKPIFLGGRAKRSLERAVWNDTSFLASIDVMDYSLLVGVDDERNELVLGIIDFMRQYTWDKHLETWVKASGILGGPKNAPPTVISPKQYKKRFRKAMTTYFLTLPDRWSS